MSTPSLASQIALVTGGAKGYGAGIARALRDSGARVWITGRDETALRATAALHGLDWVRADVTSPADWDRALEVVLNSTGRLDVLVNNAGGGVKIAPIADQADADIERSIGLNLLGPLYGCRRVAPIMRRAGRGTIVNISSVCARHAWADWGVYSAAKAGLDQFAKSLYLELRPHGVRVTTVIPSWGATNFSTAAHLGPRDESTLKDCIQPAELGRMVADICALPPHLCMQETILWPMVQEVSPL